MALPQGIYFRATDNRTDPTNYDAETATAATSYPWTSAQGNSVGWETAIHDTRDRADQSSVNLSGIAFDANADRGVYRIDLPSAGTYAFRVAAGDADSAQRVRFRIVDTSTVLHDIDYGNIGITNWVDASGVARAAAGWATDNVLVTLTFSTSICRFWFGEATVGTNPNWAISSVYVEQIGGGGGATPKFSQMLTGAGY